MGDVDDNDDYIDELTGLVEPSGELMFTSSDSKLTIEIDELTNVGNSIAILILVTCLLGLINGIDYTQPESGLVRPDEFVFRFAQSAPDESAIFNGHVFDDQANLSSMLQCIFHGMKKSIGIPVHLKLIRTAFLKWKN